MTIYLNVLKDTFQTLTEVAALRLCFHRLGGEATVLSHAH